MFQPNPAPGFVRYPDHRIEITPVRQEIEIVYQGQLLAKSDQALLLVENNYPGRYYIPKSAIQMSMLTESDHQTHCPFKGDARYWHIVRNGNKAENAAWAYDAPYDECYQLKDHIAFYAGGIVGLEQRVR